jgi:hypothetical protein
LSTCPIIQVKPNIDEKERNWMFTGGRNLRLLINNFYAIRPPTANKQSFSLIKATISEVVCKSIYLSSCDYDDRSFLSQMIGYSIMSRLKIILISCNSVICY